jgi:hypothetical protein
VGPLHQAQVHTLQVAGDQPGHGSAPHVVITRSEIFALELRGGEEGESADGAQERRGGGSEPGDDSGDGVDAEAELTDEDGMHVVQGDGNRIPRKIVGSSRGGDQ